MNDMGQPDYDEVYPDSQPITLPHSLEAEQGVIGGLMLAGESVFDQIASLVREEDFFRPEHRLIFSTLSRLAEDREPFDSITICEDLSSRKELEKAGGSTYITDLAASTPSAANVEAYARIVRERATLRQLIEAADVLKSRSYNTEGLESRDLLSDAEKRLIDIAEGGPKDDALKDTCLLYTSPSPRDQRGSRMPSSA